MTPPQLTIIEKTVKVQQFEQSQQKEALMDQIAMNDKGEVASSISKKCFTVKKFAEKNKQEGTWPDSEFSIWALRAGSPQNGFGEAFITVGRRVLVVEQRFWEAVTRLQEVKNASAR
jgi:hypothetical protein